MKLNCPACGEPFEGETELDAMLKVATHLKSIPETEHIAQLAVMLKELERLMGQDRTAQEVALSAETRQIFDKCARFDERLRTVQLMAVSGLTLAIDQLREMLQECSEYIGIRDRTAGQTLMRNLSESLRVADYKYRH